MMKALILAASSALILGACTSHEPSEAGDAPAVAETSSLAQLKLFTFDCGKIEISDLGAFATDGSYDGQADTFSDACFVVQHASGTLLWDLGLPGNLVGQDPFTDGIFTVSLETTLSDQIAATPGIDKIEYVAVSHMHFDHVGQQGAADGATWLVHETELAAIKTATDIDYSSLLALEQTIFTGDYDVFGDGSVKILSLPGHTPGHTALLVNLTNAGPVLLTGDLYHRQESRENQLVPVFNTDAAQTLASMAQFEALAEELGARVIIQHRTEDLAALPKPPLGLD